MKKTILALFALCSLSIAGGVDAGECRITSSRSPKASNVIQANGGFNIKNYDTVCKKLNDANAAFQIFTSSSVLDNRSVAWAAITLKDLNTDVIAIPYYGSSTQLNPYASQDKADEIMMDAINSAIDSLDIDGAIDALNKNRMKLKKSKK